MACPSDTSEAITLSVGGHASTHSSSHNSKTGRLVVKDKAAKEAAGGAGTAPTLVQVHSGGGLSFQQMDRGNTHGETRH